MSAATTHWDAIVLDPKDNVATALRHLAQGEQIRVQLGDKNITLTTREAIPLCHKLAIVDIAPQADVLKYGLVIGQTTAPISTGQHVHIHNIASQRAQSAAASD
ncbi:MAG: UxaA family hydrolase [Candidatus Competibacteraceae bacterium]|nr:UxaA family hydrolase [Candidatus Competibacteraceae bacterium]MCB1813718.1 UxaA family hydrolase [Candidatus Competibacteraceae bacterium]